MTALPDAVLRAVPRNFPVQEIRSVEFAGRRETDVAAD